MTWLVSGRVARLDGWLDRAVAARVQGPWLRRAVRTAPLAVYAAGSAYWFERRGIPLARDWLLPWILGLLLTLSVSNLGRFVHSFLLEWLPFGVLLTVYDFLRGIADGHMLPAHARPQIWVDKYVFGGGTVPTVWLQRHLWDPRHVHWYDFATYAVYMTYFAATLAFAAVLWLRASPLFRRYIVTVTVVTFAAFATFVVFPAFPPWLASQSDILPPTTRILTPIGAHIPPILDLDSLYERGAHWSNQIAAIPSLHEAYTVLIALFAWRTSGRLLRLVLVLYPAAMAFALVYSGEHYVIDLVLGAVYAWAGFTLCDRVARRRAARAAA